MALFYCILEIKLFGIGWILEAFYDFLMYCTCIIIIKERLISLLYHQSAPNSTDCIFSGCILREGFQLRTAWPDRFKLLTHVISAAASSILKYRCLNWTFPLSKTVTSIEVNLPGTGCSGKQKQCFAVLFSHLRKLHLSDSLLYLISFCLASGKNLALSSVSSDSS